MANFMSKRRFYPLVVAAATLVTSSTAFGQVETQLRVRQLPGWDARAREGRCEIRVWVDNRAEVRMRGDAIFVRTVEGAKGRDEGSECSQALPYNSVRDFQIRQTAGRSRVTLAQEPSRMNNFTAMIAIEDAQGGGDNYAFEVTWHADADVATAPAAFFDDVRACQDAVRQRFQTQNGRGSYIDFQSFADRLVDGQERGRDRDRDRQSAQNQSRSRAQGQESIQGRGSARGPNESRELTYACTVDMRRNQVLTGSYTYTGPVLRGNERWNSGKSLR
jgi:hypothetical protein